MTPDDYPRPSRLSEVAHAGARGAVGAMAMTGVRTVTEDLGLVRETPPKALVRKKGRGLLRRTPPTRWRTLVEVAHWGVGAMGGAAFGLLPEDLRRRAWAGPVHGLAIWLSFELGLAPLLGLKQATRPKLTEQLALIADHLVYGLVLSEGRRRPRR